MNKRICQGCRKKFNRDELIKITKLKDDTLKINPKSNELGRSAYVCAEIECIKTLIKKKRIKASLKYNNFDEISKIEKELLDLINKN